MAKSEKTKALENALKNIIRDSSQNRTFGYYGCEEITIGFSNNAHGKELNNDNEIVDFMTMDSKGIIRCFEIKVSLSDLKSKAKKSFYEKGKNIRIMG